jgi:hypothetical protein
MPPYLPSGDDGSAMIEILFNLSAGAQSARAMARRWWCRGLFRATSGKRQCRE